MNVITLWAVDRLCTLESARKNRMNARRSQPTPLSSCCFVPSSVSRFHVLLYFATTSVTISSCANDGQGHARRSWGYEDRFGEVQKVLQPRRVVMV